MMRARGFTTVELIVVMVLIGVVAAIGIPKLTGDSTMAAAAYGDRAVSALRHAQHAATSHRRVVCAALAARSVILTIATAPGPSSCNGTLGGVEAGDYATDDDSIGLGGALVGTTLFFHPDGTIHANAAGSAALAPRTQLLVQAGSSTVRTIELHGETGHVE